MLFRKKFHSSQQKRTRHAYWNFSLKVGRGLISKRVFFESIWPFCKLSVPLPICSMNIVFARFYHSYVLELCKNLALPLFKVSSSSKLHKKCFLLLITYSPIPLFLAKQKWIFRWDRSTQNYNLWVCLKPNKTN